MPRSPTTILARLAASIAMAAALAVMLAGPAGAFSGTWIQTTAGPFNWSDIANWSGGTVADGVGFTASFTANITANQTVNLSGPQTIGNITFTDATTSSHNLVISGADILTLDVTTGLPVINVSQNGRSLTIASVIAGNDGLQKNSRGTLILSNTNTYTGVTRTNATGGTLQVAVLANGGINSSIGASSNAAANLLLGNASTFLYSGSANVTTDRGFTINGTAANHGATVSSSGTGTLSFDNTVALAYGTANQTRTLTLGGTNTGANTFGKVIANNGTAATSLTKSSTGRWVLDQLNTYTGVTSVTGGTLDVSVLANGGVASSIGASTSAASNLLLGNGSTLLYSGSGNVTTDRGFTINGTAANHGTTITSSGLGTLSFDNTVALAYGTANQARVLTLRGTNTGNNTFGKVIANNGTGATRVVKNDAGLWILDQANTYTGTTTVTAGTLRAGAAAGGQAFGSLSAVTTANAASAVLSLNNFNQTIGSLAGGGATGGNVSLGSGTLTLGGLNATTTYGGVISGTGGLTKTGTGTQRLSRTSTYTGPTLISAGTLQLGNNGNAGALSPSSAITNNGTLAFSRTNTITQGTNFASVIAGSGGVTKLSSGTLILNGTNTYTGPTLVTAGTLRAGAAAGGQAFGSLSAVTTANVAAAILDLNNFSQSIGSLAGGGTTGGNVSLGTATLTTGGNNTSTTYGGAISGSGSLIKSGSGTFSLTGASTYSGGTTISGGTLLANNTIGSATGTGAVAVNTGGAVGGTGSIAGALTINGGTLAPGASIATLASGPLTFNTSSTFAYELDSSVALGFAADLSLVSGNLTNSGTVNLSIADIAGSPVAFAHDTTFTLINYSGTWNSGLFTVAGNAIADGGMFTAGLNNWHIYYTATSGGSNFSGEYVHANYVNIVAVPEPSPFVLLAAGGLAGLMLRRRRA